MQAVSLACLFEDKFAPHSQRWRTTVPASMVSIKKKNQLQILPKPNTQTIPPVDTKPQLLPTPPKTPLMRKLSPTEIQFRREHNLCFTCDAKFSLGHRCAAKHYFIIQSVEKVIPESDHQSTDIDNVVIDTSDSIELHEPVQLSYNALTGLPARGSIRFVGTVYERDICILMDGGSSNNFIHPDFVKQLALPWYQVPPFKVQVDSGELLHCEGQVHNVPIQIQQHTLKVNAFVLPIATEELVLGDIWLETLDTHLVNYKQKFITFMQNDQLITLQRELHTVIEQAHLHQFRHLQNTKAISGLITLQIQPLSETVSNQLDLHTSMEPELALLLRSFQDVFQTPHGLPPARVQDHAIHLLPNIVPIKVKP